MREFMNGIFKIRYDTSAVVLLRMLDAAEGEILTFTLMAGRLIDEEGSGMVTSTSTCFTNHVSMLAHLNLKKLQPPTPQGPPMTDSHADPVQANTLSCLHGLAFIDLHPAKISALNRRACGFLCAVRMVVLIFSVILLG
jgi:hypothetical protein